MMLAEKTIRSLSLLGTELDKACRGDDNKSAFEFRSTPTLIDLIETAHLHNPWFIPQFARHAVHSWAMALTEDKISRWLSPYSLPSSERKEVLTVALIMAGNIPLVGLHDLLCVLASGHRALVKMSAHDNQLIPALLDILFEIHPLWKDRVKVSETPMKGFDAIIATGSNNSSRYFEYYFGKYPHIIRKNRNGVAIISGNESPGELAGLASDMLMYFGLGCRNVSKIYIPEDFNMERILPAMDEYAFIADHNKYRNNYDYQKAVLLINRVPHTDNAFLLFREENALISPISVVHFEKYRSRQLLDIQLNGLKEQIQCLVSADSYPSGSILPGMSQSPELWDYADGVDTMEFLMQLDFLKK